MMNGWGHLFLVTEACVLSIVLEKKIDKQVWGQTAIKRQQVKDKPFSRKAAFLWMLLHRDVNANLGTPFKKHG